ALYTRSLHDALPIFERALASRLAAAAGRNELIDRITVAGHGEPTLHPLFDEIAERLSGVRDAVAPGVRLAVMSNSTTAAGADVRSEEHTSELQSLRH